MKRLPFVFAAALTAAAVANPLVETISDSGVFGGGYADRDQSSVVPTVAIAALFACAFVIARTLRALRGPSRAESFVAATARDFARRAPSTDVPIVIALQFLALYAMERAECFAHHGTPGGLAWLGGPILFAVLTHAVTGIVTTMVMSWALRTLADLLASAVRATLAAIASVGAADAPPFSRRCREAIVGSSLAHVRRTRGRAPPSAPEHA